jgi:hypothetical protein
VAAPSQTGGEMKLYTENDEDFKLCSFVKQVQYGKE